MASMSYCRMENTNSDLAACVGQVQDAIDDDVLFETFREKLSSEYERRAFDRLYDRCKEFMDAVDRLQENS